MISAVQSAYVPMHDGTRLAVDVVLPEAASRGAKVGAVVRATRYWRSAVDAIDTSAQDGEADLFTHAGLALVRVDVRGTGASFGTWAGPWSPQEIADLAEVVDWVATQEWCNGRIGAHGVSYDGNTAELIGSLGCTAVVAAATAYSTRGS